MAEALPAYLSAMQNGVLGEARARAFLLDRFWVLQRSVDVQGADLLVQMRSLDTSLLDPTRPRIGFVQVKYLQDENTSITIPAAYVKDEYGVPYAEFFLLVCTGNEDAERLYLLTAAEVVSTFDTVASGEKEALRLPGRALLRGSNFEVRVKRIALDRIEHALRGANLTSNRRYLRNIGAAEIGPDQIDSDYILPLPNWWGDIRTVFYRRRLEARSLLYALDDVADALDAFLQATDPAEADTIHEGRIAPHFAGGTLSFSANVLFDDDLRQVVREHKSHLARVRAAGIEGAYFGILEHFDREARRIAREQDASMLAIHATVSYDPKTLDSVSVRLVEEPTQCSGDTGPDNYAAVISNTRGHHELCYDARHALNRNSFNDPAVDPSALHLPFRQNLDAVLLGLQPSDGYF